MKSILISIKPEWVAKILNGEKTIEVRKTAPKCDLPVDVYVYCTEPNAKEVLSLFVPHIRPILGGRAGEFIERRIVDNPSMRWSICNGKVVAKFTLRKVEKIDVPYPAYFHEVEDMYKHITEGSLLCLGALHAYLGTDSGYAWHISDLVIFDEPKTLSKRPPQSWCYVEEKE